MNAAICLKEFYNYLLRSRVSLHRLERANYVAILIPGIWLCIGLLFCPTDNGGSGLALAFNILTWMTLALTLIWLPMMLPLSARNGGLPWPLTAGAVLWTLPILWAPSADDRLSSLPHVLALWGYMAVLWWLRCSASSRVSLTVLWVTALTQGSYGLYQLVTGVSEIRPMGTFYQPNLLASVLATGFACLLYQRWLEPVNKGKPLFRMAQGFTLIFIPFMLVLSQSRTGCIGALMAAGLLLALVNRTMPRWLLVKDLTLIFLGVLLAFAWQHGLIIISKQSSSQSRWLIIRTTWHLIQQHPWRGWGYGSFERDFGNQLVADSAGYGLPLIHPHNELLFAWAEGGVIALAGILLMVAGILQGLWNQGGARWGGLAMLLPLAIHINLEYPLYQSVPHGLILILLLAMTLAPAKGSTGSNTRPRIRPALSLWLSLATLILAAMIIVFMVGALQTQRQIIAIERQAMMPLAFEKEEVMAGLWNKIGFIDRLDYDQHVALLMRYNHTRDLQLLFQFDNWAERYLQRHADTNVATSRLMIARVLTPSRYPEMCNKLHIRYPDEPRVACSALTP